MVRTIVAGAVALLLVPGTALAQDRGAPPVVIAHPMPGFQSAPMERRDGPIDERFDGRSDLGGYQRPGYGMTLPRNWIAPSYYLGDYDRFGLPVPGDGFGWSRYYDDAVLTDRYGRVYDARYDFERGRDDRPRRRHRHDRHDRGGDYSYEGRWTGSWDGGPVRTYEGRFDGRVQPHWDMGYFDGRGSSYGYAPAMAYGDCGCGDTVTTVTTTSTPATTRRVSYATVREAVPYRAVRRAAPRGKYVRLAR